MTPLLPIVAMFALVMSGLNWLVFVAVTIMIDLPLLRRATNAAAGRAIVSNNSETDKLLDTTGSLARAFRTAGAAPTAAAMSVLCLLVAGVAAGLERLG